MKLSHYSGLIELKFFSIFGLQPEKLSNFLVLNVRNCCYEQKKLKEILAIFGFKWTKLSTDIRLNVRSCRYVKV